MRMFGRKSAIIYAMLLSAMLVQPLLSGFTASKAKGEPKNEAIGQKVFGIDDMEKFLDLHNRRNSSWSEPGGPTVLPLTDEEEALYKEMFPVMITELRARYDKPVNSVEQQSSVKGGLGGGEDCETARVIDVLPFNDFDDTTGHSDDVVIGVGSCQNGDVRIGTSRGPDIVYRFSPTEDCIVQIRMNPFDEGDDVDDLSLYVLNGSCSQCIIVSDEVGSGMAEEIAFSAKKDTVYFIVVDSGGTNTNAAGPYELRVTCTQKGEVRRTINPPTTIRPIGLENDGDNNLWLTDNAFDEIQLIDRTGAFITGGSYLPNTVNGIGITTDGNNLFVTDTGDASIGDENVDIFTVNGVFTGSFPTPQTTFPEGITYNQNTNSLFVVDPIGSQVLEYSTNGTPMATFPLNGSSQDGIAYDPVNNSYFVYDSGTDMVREYDPSFIEIDSFPGTISNGFGAGEGVAVSREQGWVFVAATTLVEFTIIVEDNPPNPPPPPPSEFDFCVQADNRSRYIAFNSETGQYRYEDCSKNVILEGTGNITRDGCKIGLLDKGPDFKRPDRLVGVIVNTCTFKGDAGITLNNRFSRITDDDIRNNTCRCDG